MSKRFELDFREEIQNFQPVSRTPQFQQRVPFQHSGFSTNYDYSGYRNPFMNFMSGSNVQISYRDENGEEIPADPEYAPENAAMRTEDAAARRFIFRQNVNQPTQLYQANQLAANSLPSSNRQFPTNNFRLLNNDIQLVNPQFVASVPLRYDNRQETGLGNVQQPPNLRVSQRPDYDSEKRNENSEVYEVKSSVGEEEALDDKPPLEKVDPTLPLTDTDESVNEIVDIPVQDVGEAEDEAEQSKNPFIINEGGVDEKNDDETLDTASTNNFAYSYSHYRPHQPAQAVDYRQVHGNYIQQPQIFQHMPLHLQQQPQPLQQQREPFQQQNADYQRPANYYQHIVHYQPDPAENYIGKPSSHTFSDNH